MTDTDDYDAELQARIDTHKEWEYSGLGAQCKRCQIGITGCTEVPTQDDVVWDCRDGYFPSCDEHYINSIHEE